MQVFAICMLQTFTLGNILIYGLFTEDLSAPTHMNVTQVETLVFLGDLQYLVFLFMGVLVGPILWYTAAYRKPAVTTLLCIGTLAWSLGYGLSVQYDTAYTTYAGVLIGLGATGAGILYWISLWYLSILFANNPQQLIPAFFFITTSPYIFVSVVSPIIAALTPSASTSLWYMVYIGMSIFCAILFSVCTLIISFGEIRSSKSDGIMNNVNYIQIRTAGTETRVSLGIYLLAVLMFQTAYYVPFVHVAQFMVQSIDDLSTRDPSLVLGDISSGTIVGKFIVGGTIIAFYQNKEQNQIVRITTMLTSMLMMITLYTWLACTASFDMMLFGMFYGITSGGTLLSFHYQFLISWGDVFEHNTRIMFLSLARASGQLIITFSNRYGLIQFGATGPVYFAAIFATGMWILFIVVMCIGPRDDGRNDKHMS